ncbi:ABC transporter substrate-binding protein [Pantoea sp. Taur]|uniref:ABC transporter substrate-binding protein n=1 Tax=Pantoea sp. Taur TaxID=2576757 RepID=UPI00135441B1|nr:ABC transporter substrate-binding protein [Pantoea sp. Taur]MXP60904.1 ABC transporter substrate-binding protein [Pantoea sp. Taur]
MVTRRRFLAGCAAVPAFSYLSLNTAFADTPPSMFVMAMQLDNITSLDPHESFEATGGQICGNMYQRLVTPDPQKADKVIGQLAKSWDVSSDNSTYTFHLDPAAKFADGTALTAEDVAYSIERIVKLDKSPAFIINQFGFTKDNVTQRVTAKDAHTVEMKLGAPAAETFLLYCLSATVGSIVSKKACEANQQNNDFGNAWLKQHSAGSGAFTLRTWKASETVILELSPLYADKSKIKRVILKHITDPAAQALMVKKGDVDAAYDLTTEQLLQVKNDSNVSLVNQSLSAIMLMSCNTNNEYLKKPQVWQALKWALDYDSIQKNILSMSFVTHQSFLPSGFPAALDDTPFHKDVAKAKSLLAEAGYPNGFEITLDHYSMQPYPDIAQAIQTQLGAIGIKVSLIAAENRQVLTKMRARQHQLALTVWGADYFDPNSNTEAFCVNTDNSENARSRTLAWRCSWSDEEFNKLTAQALHEPDPAKRIALYQQIQQLGREKSPFIFMMQKTKNVACGKNISDVHMTVLEQWPYDQVKKA